MQKESTAEIELSLKKKARRRLVGAIALVLLMVILLPILLKDRSADTNQEQVEITIADEAGLPQTEVPAPAASDFDSNVVSSEPVSPVETQVTLPPATTETLPPAQVANSTPDEKLVDEKIAETPKVVTNKASLLKESVEQSVNKPAVKPTADKSQFFVQVGVFSDPNNVKQLQAKLTSIGYSSKTEKVSTPKGEKIRLKTQVFSSRNDAAEALQKIKEAGLTGMVVSQ